MYIISTVVTTSGVSQMQKLSVAVLAATIVFIAGCGLDYDKIEPKLVPGYTIQGTPGEVIVLDPSRVFHRGDETFARVGEQFYLAPVWLLDGKEVSLPLKDTTKVNAVIVDNANVLELLDHTIQIELRGRQSGIATIYCSVSLTHRGVTRRYRVQETVNIYCPESETEPLPEVAPLPEERYEEPKPPPIMAAVFKLFNP